MGLINDIYFHGDHLGIVFGLASANYGRAVYFVFCDPHFARRRADPFIRYTFLRYCHIRDIFGVFIDDGLSVLQPTHSYYLLFVRRYFRDDFSQPGKINLSGSSGSGSKSTGR